MSLTPYPLTVFRHETTDDYPLETKILLTFSDITAYNYLAEQVLFCDNKKDDFQASTW